jgi:hypothetical protein
MWKEGLDQVSLINAGDLHWKIVSVYVNRMNQVIRASIPNQYFRCNCFGIKSFNYLDMMSVNLTR